MFEGIVSSVLLKVLGDYIQNLDSNSLNIGVFSGKVELRNLSLKPTALDSFDLPVTVVKGTVGYINAEIPWKSLGSSPVIARVSDVFLVVQPKKCNPWNADIERQRFESMQKSKISSYETQLKKELEEKQKEEEKSEKDDKKKDDGFVSRLTETVINNLQVHIENVHIRYEDTSDPDPAQAVVLGVSLKGLHAISCDENWVPAFIKKAGVELKKKVELNDFCVYLINTMQNEQDKEPTTLLSSIQSVTAFQKIMLQTVGDVKSDSMKADVILGPIDGTLKLVMQKESEELDLSKPKIAAELELGSVSLTLHQSQYRSLLRTLDYMSNYSKIEKFRRWKPAIRPAAKPQETPTTSPAKQWWKFALKSASSIVEKKYFTWDRVKQRKAQKEEYITLYKKKKKLDKFEQKKKQKLEVDMDTNLLIFSREIAEAELKLIEEQKKKKKKEAPTEKPKSSGGWFSSWYSGSAKKEEEEEEDSNLDLTEEQKQFLYSTIGYDAQAKVEKAKLPDNYEKIKIKFKLGGGVIKLNDSVQTIISAEYSDLHTAITLREASGNVHVGVGLQSFVIRDEFCKDTKYPKILYKREDEADAEVDQLVDVSVETAPLHGKSDLDVHVTLGKTDIVFNIPLLQKIISFFVVPSSVNLQFIEEAAKKQLNNIQQQALTQLRMALEDKKVLDISVMIRAPRLIIPKDCSDDSSEIILVDLGKFRLKSDIDREARTKRIKEETVEEKDFYDRYDFELNDIQVLLVPNKASFGVEEQLEQNPLLHKVNIGMQFANCITRHPTYPATKLEGKIPKVKLVFSPKKFDTLMFTVYRILELVDNPTGTSSARLSKKGLMKVRQYCSNSDRLEEIKTMAVSDEFKEFDAELRQDGRLLLFDRETTTLVGRKPIACVSLTTHSIKLIDGSESKIENVTSEDIVLRLPQADKNTSDIYVVLRPSADKELWKEKLADSLLTYASYDLVKPSVTSIPSENTTIQTSNKANTINMKLNLVLEEFDVLVNFADPTKKNSTEELPLAQLKLSTLTVDVMARKFDQEVVFKLRTLEVEYLLQRVDEASRYILHSTGNDNTGDIAEIRLVLCSHEHSEQYSLNADTSLSMKFATFNLYFDPLAMSKFVLFGYSLLEVLQTNSSKNSRMLTMRAELPPADHSHSTRPTKRNSIRIDANMSEVSLTLHDSGTTFAFMSMRDTSVFFTSGDDGVFVDGEVGNLVAEDRGGDTQYKEILGLGKVGNSVVKFSFESTKEIKEDLEYGRKLKIVMESVKFIYLNRFIGKIQLYFVDGPLMDALKEGGRRIQKMAAEGAKKQIETSETSSMLGLDLTFETPIVFVPVSQKSSDFVHADLGRIRVYNVLSRTDKLLLEDIRIELTNMNMKTLLNHVTKSVVDKVDIDMSVKRVVSGNDGSTPNVDFSMTVSEVAMKLTQLQYQMIFRILDQNINDSAVPTKKSAPAKPQELPESAVSHEKQVDSLGAKTSDRLKNLVTVNFPHLNLTIFRGSGDNFGVPDPIGRMNMYGLKVIVQSFEGSTRTTVNLSSVDAYDMRSDSKSHFKQFIDSRTQNTNFLELLIESKSAADVDKTYVNVRMGNPRVIFEPQIVSEIQQFFTEMRPNAKKTVAPIHYGELASNQEEKGDIKVTANTWFGNDITLSQERKLCISRATPGEIIIDGEGHTISFNTNSHSDSNANKKLIQIAKGVKVKFRNITFRLSTYDSLDDCIELEDNTSVFTAPSTQGVFRESFDPLEPVDKKENVVVEAEQTEKQTRKQRQIISLQLGEPHVVFPVDAENANTHLFVVRANLKMNMDFEEAGKRIELNIQQLTAYTETSSSVSDKKIVGAPILEPIDMLVRLDDEPKNGLRTIKASIKGILKVRLAYQDVKMITQIVNAFKSTEVKKTEVISKEQALERALQKDDNVDENSVDEMSDRSDEEQPDDDDDFEDVEETPTPISRSTSSVFTEQEDKSKALDVTGQFSVNRFDDKSSLSEISTIEEEAPNEEEPQNSLNQVFEIDPNQQLSILIVDDVRGYDIPLMHFVLSELTLHKGFMARGGLNIGVKLTFCLNASYYNMSLADWEPIIEPWRAEVAFNRLESTETPGKPTDEINIADNNQTKTMLNFNVTQSMIRSVITTSQLWRDEFSGKNVSRKVEPYLIRNHSGYTIKMQKQNQMTETVTLPPRKEYGFDYGKHIYSKADSEDNENIILSFPELNSLQRIVNVRVSTQTTFQSKEGLIGMIDVELKEGRKVITVRSGIKVKNLSTKSWLIGYGNLKEQNLVVIGEIKPGEDVGVPMNAVMNGTFCIRPKGEKKESPFWWSAAMNGFKFTELMLMENRSRPVECHNKDQSKGDMFCAVIRPIFTKPMSNQLAQLIKNDVNKEKTHLLQQRNCIIEIRAPLCIENLFACDLIVSAREKDKLESNESKLLHKGENKLMKSGEKIHLYRASMRSHILFKAFPANNGSWKSRTSALIYVNPAAMKTSKDRIAVTSQLPIIDEKGRHLKVHFDYSRSQGSAFREVMVYVPYWLMNHTKKKLTIREMKDLSAGQEQSLEPMLTDDLKVPKTEDELKLEEYQKNLLMFSFNNEPAANVQNSHKISIKVEDTAFSEFFSVDNVGISGNLSLTSSKKYAIGFSTAVCPGKFNRTKLVTFYSRYVFVNETSKEVIFKQANHKSGKEFHLPPKERSPYYWDELDVAEPNLICTIADADYVWSAPFGLNKLDEMAIKMNKKTSTGSGIHVPSGYILNVNISEQKGCILVTLREPTDPPYLIDNTLDCDIVINQTNIPKQWKIPSQSKVAYAWDNLTGTQKLSFLLENYQPKELDINEVKEAVVWQLQSTKDKSVKTVHVSVKPKGNTRVIQLTNAKPIKQKQVEEKKEEFTLFLSTTLSGVGLSIIDNYPREICYITISDIMFRYETTDTNMYVEFTCLSLQVDNMLRDANFPVAFSPVNDHSYVADPNKHYLVKPFLHLSMCKSLGLSDDSLSMFRYLSVNLQEAMIQIDYTFIENVINVVDDLTADDDQSKLVATSTTVDKDIQALNGMLDEVADTTSNTNGKYYFETLELHPIRVHLTFRFNTSSSEDELDLENSQSLKGRLYNLLKSLGFLTNIDEAPICLNPLILEHPLMTRDALQDRITKHYTRCATYELYKIVGSLELIGNPVGLFNDLTTGVKDLFYEPASSITKSPEEFSRGLARGSLSMLTHSIHGTFNTASKITGTIGKGLSVLTLDESYVKQRERSQTRKARGVREGLMDGTEALAKGVFEGATGVFTQPVKGAKEEGVLGVLKGFGKGLIGIPTKPLSGLVDFAAKTTEGISNIGTTHHDRKRKPRTFRNDGLLLPYDDKDAFAADILYYLNDGTYMRKSNYVTLTTMIEPERAIFHMPDDDPAYIYLLTNRAIMRVKLASKSTMWVVEMKQIQSCQGSEEVIIKTKDKKEYKVKYTKDKTYMMKFKTQINLMVNSQPNQ